MEQARYLFRSPGILNQLEVWRNCFQSKSDWKSCFVGKCGNQPMHLNGAQWSAGFWESMLQWHVSTLRSFLMYNCKIRPCMGSWGLLSFCPARGFCVFWNYTSTLPSICLPFLFGLSISFLLHYLESSAVQPAVARQGSCLHCKYWKTLSVISVDLSLKAFVKISAHKDSAFLFLSRG